MSSLIPAANVVGTRIEPDSRDDRKRKFTPVHEQTVVDEQGRRRFHGAFTGGFSAGYFNTVGSAEGFTPQQFRSSRSQHAESQRQDVKQFMDAEDFAEFGLEQGVVANRQFSSIGQQSQSSSTAHVAANAATNAASVRQSAPFVPDELLQPARHGIGISLLQTMGWRDGEGVGARKARRRVVAAVSNADDPDGVIAKFEFAPRSVPVPEFLPKDDRRGIGFDPYTNADDFRAAAERRREFNRTDERTQEGMRTRLTMANAVTGAEDRYSMRGFGIGALDEDNADEDADLYHNIALEAYDIDRNPEEQQHRIERDSRKAMRDAAAAAKSSGSARSNTAARLLLEDVDRNTLNSQRCSDGLPPLKGFRLAARTTEKEIHFPPPKVPPQFTGVHIFGPNDERPEDLPTFQRRVTPQQRADLLADGQRVVRPAVGSQPPLASAVASIASRFAPAGATVTDAAAAPPPPPPEVVVRRTTQAWEPARIVCKRVNVPDPWAKRQLPVDAVRAILEPKLLSASVAAVTSTRSFTQGATEQQQQQVEEPPAEPIVRPSADIFNAVFGADDSDDEHVIPPPPPPPTQTAATTTPRENEFSRHAQPLVPEMRPVTVDASLAAASTSGRQAAVSFAQLAESLGSHARPRDVPRRPQALPIDVGGPLMRGADGVMGPMPPPPAKERHERERSSSSASSSSSSSSESDDRREKRKRKSSKHHHHRHSSKKSRKSSSKSKKKH
jgi:hypothetical protein